MSRRLSRAELAAHYAQEWLAERELAETQPCPPRPLGCGVPAGQTCMSTLGRPLTGPPAHAARIRAADRAPRRTCPAPHPPSPPGRTTAA